MLWHEHYENPLSVTLQGVAAGLGGTLVMTTALRAVDQFTRGSDEPAGEPPVSDANVESGAVGPTERVAERLASRVFRTELSRETRQRLGLGIYWTYGAFWGALSSQIQETFHP